MEEKSMNEIFKELLFVEEDDTQYNDDIGFLIDTLFPEEEESIDDKNLLKETKSYLKSFKSFKKDVKKKNMIFKKI